MLRLLQRNCCGEIKMINTKVVNGKITWGALLAAAKAAGIKPDDPIDSIDIAWGDSNELRCVRDDDFGWQIALGEDVEDVRYSQR